MKNFNAWLKGLGVAVASALFTSAVGYFAVPQAFNFSAAGLRNMAIMAIPIAAKVVLAYLKQSPIPQA